MANSATHPCAYCTVNKNDLLNLVGLSRTIGFIKSQTECWLEPGGKEKNAKQNFSTA